MGHFYKFTCLAGNTNVLHRDHEIFPRMQMVIVKIELAICSSSRITDSTALQVLRKWSAVGYIQSYGGMGWYDATVPGAAQPLRAVESHLGNSAVGAASSPPQFLQSFKPNPKLFSKCTSTLSLPG
jgi:hypothetical protein